MRVTPVELLDLIDAAGGRLTVLPDRGLNCLNIPPDLYEELVRNQEVIVGILSGEFERRPSQPMDKRKLRKLLEAIQDSGGNFHISPSGRFFDFIHLPDEQYRDAVLDNAGALFDLVVPKRPKTSSRPKRTCKICPSGSGCRTPGASGLGHELLCPNCNHGCRCHYPATIYPCITLSAGCGRQVEDDKGEWSKCDCPGWPAPPVKAPRKGRGKKAIAAGVQLPLMAPPVAEKPPEGEVKQ